MMKNHTSKISQQNQQQQSAVSGDEGSRNNTSTTPWQFQWKRPQWQVLEEKEECDDDEQQQQQQQQQPQPKQEEIKVEGTCLGMVSAMVAREEFELPSSSFNDSDDDDDDDDESPPAEEKEEDVDDNDNSVYMLNVTLVSSPFCVETSGFGDLIVLELVRQSAGPTSNKTTTTTTEEEKGDDEDPSEEKSNSDEPPADPDDDGGGGGGGDDDDNDTTATTTTAKADRILMKVLRWPGVALQNDQEAEYKHEQEEAESVSDCWFPSWLGGTRRSRRSQSKLLRQRESNGKSSSTSSVVGVVATCLCRKLVGEDDKQKALALSALDTMTFLSLGMDPEIVRAASAVEEPPSAAGGASAEHQGSKTRTTTAKTELLLACICSDGRVHVYSPWKLLQVSSSENNIHDYINHSNKKRKKTKKTNRTHTTGRKSKNKKPVANLDGGSADAFADSMSSFLLGGYVFQQLRSNIWPLSQPEATVKLTIPISKPGQQGKRVTSTATEENDYDNDINNNIFTPSDNTQAEESTATTGLSLWDRSVWDPQVDPFTAIYRTVDNIPTQCVSAFEYVVIAGRGKRVHTTKRATTTTTTTTASSTASAKSSSSKHHHHHHHQQQQQQQQGGFITLLSLQNFAEVRTLYLPFVPKVVSPFAWGGMQFLFVIGDQGVAVAIRIDISVYNSVICGEAPSLGSNAKNQQDLINNSNCDPIIPTVNSDQSFLSYQSTNTNSSHHHPHHPRHNQAEGASTSGRAQQQRHRCFVHRFQILPIVLPETISDEYGALSVAKATLSGSSPYCSPPEIVMVSNNHNTQQQQEQQQQQQQQILVLQRLEAVNYIRATSINSTTYRLFRGYRRSRTRRILAITTSHEPRHVARIVRRRPRSSSEQLLIPPPPTTTSDSEAQISAEGTLNTAAAGATRIKEEALNTTACDTGTWCHLGQGWCLFGIESSVYFVCWEGATSSEGPFVCELEPLSDQASTTTAADTGGSSISHGLHCDVMPIDPFVSIGSDVALHNKGGGSFSYWHQQKNNLFIPQGEVLSNESKKLRRLLSGEMKKAEMKAASSTKITRRESGMDSMVVEAIQSISIDDYRQKNNIDSNSPSALESNIHKYSHREKSIRLLEKCPTWSELEDTKQNRIRMEGQVPSVNVRLRNQFGNSYLLTLRRCADSGLGTPYHQILSWLSQNADFFTAASVALDLKKDAATLKHLWRSFDRIDEDDERTKLEGLLDGIIPIHEQMTKSDADLESDQFMQLTLIQLADMTIGCLCRGGFAMSSTLEFFLQQDTHYDGSRTCLLLAAIAAQAVANEEGTLESLMGSSYLRPTDQEQFVQDITWPVRCLLQVGVSRNILPTALALINAACPDELRRRRQHEQLDSMTLCVALVKLIIGSSPDATELLFDLVDEQEGKRFWNSLDHDTQKELALVRIDNKCPLLRQLEVRSWALGYLQGCLQNTASDIEQGEEGLLTDWLRSLCTGCLINAACGDLLMTLESRATEADVSGDGLAAHIEELAVTRDALIAGDGSGGLDFNLIIPALLLLENYKKHWNNKTWVSTQSILNAACKLAGRVTVEEPLFAFDGTSLMKQCYLAGNVCAGANLLGGKNGLILECCWVLTEFCGLSMDEAEPFLRKDEFKLVSATTGESSESEKVTDDFVLCCGHKHVLWLLDEHVLQVKTYGEFDSPPARGKVNPVFAARVCLRTWYVLTKSQLPAASDWFVSWLRRQLGIDNDTMSRKRLACAALTQVLLWSPGPENANVLAEQMKLESRFLVQLSEACWNLVEAVPPAMADELLSQEAVDSPGKKRIPKANYIS